jgi:hypothetical protein
MASILGGISLKYGNFCPSWGFTFICMLVLLLYTDVISAVFVNRQRKIAITTNTSLFSFGGSLLSESYGNCYPHFVRFMHLNKCVTNCKVSKKCIRFFSNEMAWNQWKVRFEWVLWNYLLSLQIVCKYKIFKHENVGTIFRSSFGMIGPLGQNVIY